MQDTITRRDFLNGFAIAIGASLAPSGWLRAADASAYPPAETGMRGGAEASCAVAHALRDGRRFAFERAPSDGDVDLAVIGAGLGGLAAAFFHLRKRPDARILILDNHDDFGGHARRCEMRIGERLILSYGGSESIQSPRGLWSETALGLLRELGVDLNRFESAFDRTLYPGLGLSRGVLFTREAFGVDRLAAGDPTRMVADDIPPDRLNARSVREFIGAFPLDAPSRRRLIELYTRRRDIWPGKSPVQKMELLASMSYRDYLRRHWDLGAAAANVFQKRPHDFYAVGADLLPALEAASTGYPGFDGLGLPTHPQDAAAMNEPYIYHFPDGNASIARLLVRRLIPGVAPGDSMEDIVTAPFNYERLDSPGANTRLRLHSTVVSLANSADRVNIGYVRAGETRRVQARRAVFAGYNMMLPYISRELDQEQRTALAYSVKAPIVYVKLALRRWGAWVDAGVHEVTNPMGFYSRMKLDYPVSLGDYRCAHDPQEPIALHLVHAPIEAGAADQRTAWRAGRTRLQKMRFADFERSARDELTRVLGARTFDFQRDVAAMTVYRWAHGYAYGFNSLFDRESDLALQDVARRPIGRIAIANSDAAWSAYAHAAIDEAARAVAQLDP
ncbi:MAG TPA: NAD(P)-binding protein [Steroidobacter sp.]|nr:NAD(P)-binding protein [Steroidobacter sp.]